jgi:hypothetical protein
MGRDRKYCYRDRMRANRWPKIEWNYKFTLINRKKIKGSKKYDTNDVNIQITLKWEP